MWSIKATHGSDIRRFGIPDLSFEALLSMVHTCFEFPLSDEVVITYTDDEGDLVTVSSNRELEEAFRCHTDLLKVNIQQQQQQQQKQQKQQQVATAALLASSSSLDQAETNSCPLKLTEPKEEATKEPKTRAKKNADAPKRGMSAYLFYCSDARARLCKENPELGFIEVAKKMGNQWRSLSDEEKIPYSDLAAADKARYEEQKKEFNATGTYTKTVSSQKPYTVSSGNSEYAGPGTGAAQRLSSQTGDDYEQHRAVANPYTSSHSSHTPYTRQNQHTPRVAGESDSPSLHAQHSAQPYCSSSVEL